MKENGKLKLDDFGGEYICFFTSICLYEFVYCMRFLLCLYIHISICLSIYSVKCSSLDGFWCIEDDG